METRVFDFEVDFGGAGNVVGLLVLRPPNGNGVVRYLDEFLAMGWRPIHWSTIASEMTSVAKYRVVMQRNKKASVGEVSPRRKVVQTAANGGARP